MDGNDIEGMLTCHAVRPASGATGGDSRGDDPGPVLDRVAMVVIAEATYTVAVEGLRSEQ